MSKISLILAICLVATLLPDQTEARFHWWWTPTSHSFFVPEQAETADAAACEAEHPNIAAENIFEGCFQQDNAFLMDAAQNNEDGEIRVCTVKTRGDETTFRYEEGVAQPKYTFVRAEEEEEGGEEEGGEETA